MYTICQLPNSLELSRFGSLYTCFQFQLLHDITFVMNQWSKILNPQIPMESPTSPSTLWIWHSNFLQTKSLIMHIQTKNRKMRLECKKVQRVQLHLPKSAIFFVKESKLIWKWKLVSVLGSVTNFHQICTIFDQFSLDLIMHFDLISRTQCGISRIFLLFLIYAKSKLAKSESQNLPF